MTDTTCMTDRVRIGREKSHGWPESSLEEDDAVVSMRLAYRTYMAEVSSLIRRVRPPRALNDRWVSCSSPLARQLRTRCVAALSWSLNSQTPALFSGVVQGSSAWGHGRGSRGGSNGTEAVKAVFVIVSPGETKVEP